MDGHLCRVRPLITAIHANDVNEIVNGNLNSYRSWNRGICDGMDGGIEMIGLISIIYAICILLIPMVAAFILRGQFSAVGAGISMAVSRITQRRNDRSEGWRGGWAGWSGSRRNASEAGMGMMGAGRCPRFSTGGSAMEAEREA